MSVVVVLRVAGVEETHMCLPHGTIDKKEINRAEVRTHHPDSGD